MYKHIYITQRYRQDTQPCKRSYTKLLMNRLSPANGRDDPDSALRRYASCLSTYIYTRIDKHMKRYVYAYI